MKKILAALLTMASLSAGAWYPSWYDVTNYVGSVVVQSNSSAAAIDAYFASYNASNHYASLSTFTNNSIYASPTTNLWGATSTNAYTITNASFQVTLAPGVYYYNIALHGLTVSTNAGMNFDVPLVPGDTVAGQIWQAANGAGSSWSDYASIAIASGFLIAPNLQMTSVAHGLLYVNGTSIYRVRCYQRNTNDTAHVPMITTHSFMFFQKLTYP